MFDMPVMQQDARPPYFMFQYRAIPNPRKTEEEGRVVYDNMAYIQVVAHGSKDVFEKPAEEWFAQKRKEAMNGFYPQPFLDLAEKQFDAWKQGQEVPREGTPLSVWPVATPADVEQCSLARITTVEDLAAATETSLQILGMGGRQLRDKAKNWLEAAKDKGTLVNTVAKLEADNADLRQAIEIAAAKIAELEAAQASKKLGLPKKEAA